MAKPTTQARLAKSLGLSQQQISVLRRKGMPDDPAGARRWRRQNLESTKTKPATVSADRLRALRARTLSLEVAEKEGSLIDRRTAERTAARFASLVAQQLETLVCLAPELAGRSREEISARLRKFEYDLRLAVSTQIAGSSSYVAAGAEPLTPTQ